MTCEDKRKNDCERIVTLHHLANIRDKLGRIVCASGGFDPLHPGHTSYISESKNYGDTLIVIVNGDRYLKQKKGLPFMKLEDRCAVLSTMRDVDFIVPFETESDNTVCGALKLIRPHVFTKGGDRLDERSIPEWNLCQLLGIKVVTGVGSHDDISSSHLLEKWADFWMRKKTDANTRDDFLIEEYKLTQQFVMHYERLIWQIGSVVNASVIVMAGLLIREADAKYFWISIPVSSLFSFIWFIFAYRYRQVNLQKLRRMRELEDLFGFKQSIYVSQADRNRRLKINGHFLSIFICITTPISLLLIWILIV